MKLNEHIVETEDTISLGNGGVRIVKSMLLSRTACVAVCMNADQRKPMASVGKEYFGNSLSAEEALTAVQSNMLVYRSSRGKVQVDVIFNNDTFWLTRERMAQLFSVTPQNISYHIQQISESGEVHLSEACKKILQTSDNSSVDDLLVYNLDVVIAVGYRVNSYEAMQFRIWAISVMKEYMIKGYAMDDERLKGKNIFGIDYFEELLERIREIRTSERRYYQMITDIYAECSMDYDKTSDITREFYKSVQNIMHWAVTHQTAAEIVYERADASMQDWRDLLGKFIQFNDRELMTGNGTITHEEAEAKAHAEYDKFRIIQDQTYLSDFDKLTEELHLVKQYKQILCQTAKPTQESQGRTMIKKDIRVRVWRKAASKENVTPKCHP